MQGGAIVAKPCLSEGGRSSRCDFQDQIGVSIIHSPLNSVDLKSCAEIDTSTYNNDIIL